jgi:transposase-like protein
MPRQISKEMREEMLKRIKDEGLGVAEVSKQYGVSDSALYRWLGTSSKDSTINPHLEINRLKRENQDLRQLIGQLVYEKEKQKKLNQHD